MLTKAIIQKIDQAKNTCIVRIPLFEQASSKSFMETEATICVTPGIYNNLFVGDIVIIGFEENKIELPVILGKLFLNNLSKDSQAGAVFGDSLTIASKAILPCDTEFNYTKYSEKYATLNTPKKLADALLELGTGEKQDTFYLTKVHFENDDYAKHNDIFSRYSNQARQAARLEQGDLILLTKINYSLIPDISDQRSAFYSELTNRLLAHGAEINQDADSCFYIAEKLICLGISNLKIYTEDEVEIAYTHTMWPCELSIPFTSTSTDEIALVIPESLTESYAITTHLSSITSIESMKLS